MSEQVGSTHELVSLEEVTKRRDEFLAMVQTVGQTLLGRGQEGISAEGSLRLTWDVPEGYQLAVSAKDEIRRHMFQRMRGIGYDRTDEL